MTHNDPLKKCRLRRKFCFYLFTFLVKLTPSVWLIIVFTCCLKYPGFSLKTSMIQKVNKFHFGFTRSQEVTVTPVSRVQAADRRQLYYLASNLRRKPFNTSIYDLFPAEPVLNGTSRLSYQLFKVIDWKDDIWIFFSLNVNWIFRRWGCNNSLVLSDFSLF